MNGIIIFLLFANVHPHFIYLCRRNLVAFLQIIDHDIGHVISGADLNIFPFFECQKTIAPQCKESRCCNMVNIRINDLFTINFKRYYALTYWFCGV